MDYYKQIFKRKSFHIFKNTDTLTESEVQGLKDFIKTTKPLNPEIKTEICIVPESETTCKRGGQ
ncbi:MAG: nitroreductase, partial [Clostridiales bacterium]|nr:nitroreductase [Clostridiales bacterium]